MDNMYVNNAGIFLVQTLFGLILLLFMLRLLMQLVRADFHNPVSQFVVKLTNPLLKPLRRVIPGLFGIDMASLVVLLALQVLELFLVGQLMGHEVRFAGLLVLSLGELLDLLIKIYLYGILIQVVISWINPGSYNPALAILHAINEPLLRPARRILPPISGFDLSPILVLVALQLLSMLLLAPLADIARGLL